jgi:hypothetical protein
MKYLGVVLAVALATSLSACTTPTTVTNVWKDPAYSAGPMRKICVFSRTPAETSRRTSEDAFVAELTHHGVQASPSYALFPVTGMDRESMRQVLQKESYDGALVAEFQGEENRTTYEPGGFGMWGGSYYVQTDHIVRVQTNLWNPQTAGLVWSATTETENPLSTTDGIASIVKKVVSALTDARVIPPPAVASR